MQTWSEAFARVWENFTGVLNEGAAQLWRVLFWLLLLGGSIYAVWNYRNMLVLSEGKDFMPQSSSANVEADRQRLNAMFREVQEASNHRSNSMMTVETMRDGARYAFNDPLMQIQGAQATKQSHKPSSSVAETAAVVATADLTEQERVIEPPPAITVKAIMTLGNTRMAVMDIDGSGKGLVMQAGNKFQGRKGRIVRIDNDKVVVRWNGKNWNIAFKF